MVKRFRMIAGPNGSGKSTLVRRLRGDYSVNFYTFVNADDIFAQVAETGAYSPKFPVSKDELVRYADGSTYDESVKESFRGNAVRVEGDCVRFDKGVVNSYTMALFANFLQDRFLDRGESFSQETVFSHPYPRSIAQLKAAIPYLSRAYVFDNSGPEMRFLGEYSAESGWMFSMPIDLLPSWFVQEMDERAP